MTKVKAFIKKLFLFTCITTLLSVGIQAPVMADMISTQELRTTADVELKRDEIRSIIMQDEIRDFMIGNGISPADADQRLNNLSDREVLAMHQQLDDLTTGQGALGTIALVLIILILLDVTGITDIFPGV